MEGIGTHLRRSTTSLVAAALLSLQVLRAQPAGTKPVVMSDALIFRGSELRGTEHVDVYVAIPYQTLVFQEYEQRYAAQFKTRVAIRDSIGRRVIDTVVSRSVLVDSYAESQGSTGKAETVVLRLNVKPGRYRQELTVTDGFSGRDHSLADTLVVPDLGSTPALSSVMYVREIEQRGDRYKIAPYIGETIWSGDMLLFAFFEVYVDELPTTTAFSWDLSASDGRSLGRGVGDPVKIERRSLQQFFPLSPLERALPGSYTLTIKMHPVENGAADTTTVLASRTRRYLVPRSAAGAATTDLNLAIRQLIYVADQEDIDQITGSLNESDRQYRFEEFWKRQDPTPGSVRNEAFEEYYSRIETANRRFKSYTEGWLTDMGRVYIVYGEPTNIERFNTGNGISTVVRWSYGNSQMFTFEDNTGFGDYRMRTPLPPNAKYRYRR